MAKAINFSAILAILVIGLSGVTSYARDHLALKYNYEICKNERRAAIVGSSVSLGLFGDSPALVYLERAGFKRLCIQKKDLPLGHSQHLMPWLKDAITYFKPEIIVSMDLLIHDVTYTLKEEQDVENLRKTNLTIDYLASLNIPVIVGTVFVPRPMRYPYQVEMARAVNRRLCDESQAHSTTFFTLPTMRIYRELYANRFILPGLDRPLRLNEVLVDMYHPGPRGAYMLANRSIDYLNRLYHSQRHFPLQVKPFSIENIFQRPMTRPISQLFDPLAKKHALFGMGEDTFAVVNPSTIPDEMGDEACLFEEVAAIAGVQESEDAAD